MELETDLATARATLDATRQKFQQSYNAISGMKFDIVKPHDGCFILLFRCLPTIRTYLS